MKNMCVLFLEDGAWSLIPQRQIGSSGRCVTVDNSL